MKEINKNKNIHVENSISEIDNKEDVAIIINEQNSKIHNKD